MAKDSEKLYAPMYMVSIAVFLVILYAAGIGYFKSIGWWHPVAGNIVAKLAEGNLYGPRFFRIKFWSVLFVVVSTVSQSGGSTQMEWKYIFAILAAGFVFYFWPYNVNHASLAWFMTSSVIGYGLLNVGFALLGRKAKGGRGDLNDIYETFEQCTKKIENKYSVNIPMKFQYKGKVRNGWINVVSPQRATIIMGTPGAGKSFSVYNPFIKTMIEKNFSCFLYDYKFPDLTEELYNRYLVHYAGAKKKPKFCIVNFDDPRYSMRCNPLDARYLTDMSDAHEVADLIMKNINPKSVEKEDFFSMSAKVYIAALVWFLKKYKNGIYCSFPHLIELMGKNYKSVFKILQQDDELRIMIQPFADALKGNAQEQLQGQIASARIPLLKFPSPALYWTLTGDDFSLDINNPDDPKIICMGNNPDRQAIYGTALALYTSRMFKVINHKKNAAGKRNLPCGVLLDELPTIFIKGLDNLIATARSNLVCIVLGAQDKSQLIRDYTDKEADVIFNTVGNIFAGQVNGRTAKDLSETFGKEFREQESKTDGKDSHSTSRSFHQEELMPQSRIETLSQGYFFGKVADDFNYKIDKKLFCGEIQIDLKERERFQSNFQKVPKLGEIHKVGVNSVTGNPIYEGYFDDARVEKSVRKDAEASIKKQITKEIRNEEFADLKRDPMHHNPLSDEYVAELTDERYQEMDDDTREMVLKKAVKEAQDEAVNEMLIENYKLIQDNIREIFESYGIDEDEEEGGAGVAAGAPVVSDDGGAGDVDPNGDGSGGEGIDMAALTGRPADGYTVDDE